MGTATTVILITLSSLSFITSAATLTVVLVGGKKMQSEVEEVRTKANGAVGKLKAALENLEL